MTLDREDDDGEWVCISERVENLKNFQAPENDRISKACACYCCGRSTSVVDQYVNFIISFNIWGVGPLDASISCFCNSIAIFLYLWNECNK